MFLRLDDMPYHRGSGLAPMAPLNGRTATWASPGTTLDYQTDRALGRTILATGPRTRFTIGSTGHGMFVNIERVQGF